ncbi:MAG TPA: VWA domain-containing protein [Bryobacteraceae bacterium]|nr:VWA domain-containing protein [Bryobacteraceae bacterium]
MRNVVALLLSGLLVASAQQVPQGTVKFQATTQLVVESVSVKDKSGKPIEGLKASDFTVTEDGKPQKISVFEYQRLEETPEATATPPSLTPRPAAPAAPATAESQLAAVKPAVQNGIAPSRPGEIKYKDRRLIVMFFDMTSMPIQDQMRAQTAALKFLKTQVTPSDLMAIMTFTNDLKVVQDFTDDRDLLTKDLKGLMVGEGSDLADLGATSGDDSQADTGAAFSADDSEFNIFNTDRKLAALESAAKMLSSLPEKKALVYFASGVPKTGAENEAQLRSTINAAIRSNVSFYPIDARGLVAQAPLGDATKGSPGGQGMYSGSSARSNASNFQDQQETLYTLATDTGGKALLDNNDLALGIVQAQKDISSYYIIGYYSSNTAEDGHYRRIKVELGNKLEAKLDYRSGYFANKQFRQFNSSDRERQLQEALMLGDPITDLSIAMEVDYFRLARDRYYVPVSVKIPGTEIELAKHGGAESTRLDFIGQVTDPNGKMVGTVRDNIEVKLKGETAAQLGKRSLEYDTGFTLPPGTYSLKFLARENETGKIGTFETKFIIPDLTTQQTYLPISSVVLSNQRESLNAAVGNVERDKKLIAADPLIHDGQKLVPSVTRVFRKNQDMYVYLEAYQPAATTTQPVTATLSFYRGKVKAFETEPLQITSGLDPKSKALPVKFSVPLGKLQPGKYTCQVSVLDPTAQKFAFWRAPMVLLP